MDARPREILWMRGHGRFYGCAASEVEFRCSGRKILDSPASRRREVVVVVVVVVL